MPYHVMGIENPTGMCHCCLLIANIAFYLQAHTLAVEAVVSRLLMAACADTSVSVRRTVLQAIQAPSLLDSYLAQADRSVPMVLLTPNRVLIRIADGRCAPVVG